jgi:2-dehydro-3-deoxyphosphooctonate aldolase (KDO 8-P synthase)
MSQVWLSCIVSPSAISIRIRSGSARRVTLFRALDPRPRCRDNTAVGTAEKGLLAMHADSPRTVRIGDIEIANNRPFALIAGPCQIESRDHALRVATALKAIAQRTGVPVIYKSSYDKANRTSATAERGIGIQEGLRILAEVRDATGLPVLTDVHTEAQCRSAGQVVDVLQIPAFLCRQTDLLIAAGETGRAINVKKGQFLAPWDMVNVAAKIVGTGNPNVLLCERGASFGYNTLVSDMRSLPIMAQTGYPVVFDATHSVQQPGGQGASSGGQREFAPVLARAALAVGCAAVFIETHEDPEHAPSDGPNMIPLDQMEALVTRLAAFDRLSKGG